MATAILTDREALALFRKVRSSNNTKSRTLPLLPDFLRGNPIVQERSIEDIVHASDNRSSGRNHLGLLTLKDGSVLLLEPYNTRGDPHVRAYYYSASRRRIYYATRFDAAVE